MAPKPGVTQWQQALVEAVHDGDEAQARVLLSQFSAREARPLLESMLGNEDPLMRHAAAFGLGELGGTASVKRLEQQLALEEARGDYDGASVVEALTQALGRIQAEGARASLVRRLERLVAHGRPAVAEVGDVARALWRNRHPALLPMLRRSLEKLSLPASAPLHGLCVLLENTPETLCAWATDTAVPLELKGEVLTLLTEEVPEALISTLPAFIRAARAQVDTAASHKGTAAQYCVDLFTLLLLYPEHLLPRLTEAARADLHEMSRRLVTATSLLKCVLQGAVMLEHIGSPADIALLEAHRPMEPVLAKVFDEAAEALRQRKSSQSET